MDLGGPPIAWDGLNEAGLSVGILWQSNVRPRHGRLHAGGTRAARLLLVRGPPPGVTNRAPLGPPRAARCRRSACTRAWTLQAPRTQSLCWTFPTTSLGCSQQWMRCGARRWRPRAPRAHAAVRPARTVHAGGRQLGPTSPRAPRPAPQVRRYLDPARLQITTRVVPDALREVVTMVFSSDPDTLK